MGHVYEVSLDGCSLAFRLSVEQMSRNPGLLKGVGAFLPPDEVLYRDGAPKLYRTAETECRYLPYSKWLQTDPSPEDAKQAALGFISAFQAFESRRLPTAFLSLSHFVIASGRPNDVRIVLWEPFSLRKKEAARIGRESEPDLSRANADDAAFTAAIHARIVEKVLLVTGALWDIDYPNRSLMSPGLLSALQVGTFGLEELREAVELGFLAPEQTEAPISPAAEDDADSDLSDLWAEPEANAVVEGKGGLEHPTAIAGKSGSAHFSEPELPPLPASPIWAMYVMLAKGEGTYEKRLALHRQAEAVFAALAETKSDILTAYVSPVPGSGSLVSFTGFFRAERNFRPNLAAAREGMDNTHLIARALMISRAWSGKGIFLCIFVDNTDSYTGYGRNYSLLLSKFQRLEREREGMKCFYLCGSRPKSAGDSLELTPISDALQWIDQNIGKRRAY
ncbi:MAG: hypothetical protein LBC69_02645 [Eubacteriaceae bacterium]|jgi:hypothetical protein|nr:hypothetical protein [Eubacteriaceae bacterium]